MKNSFVEALNTQCRVIFALMMREVHTMYGKTQLRYLWVIINSIIHIGTMVVFRTLFKMSPPHGMHVLTFLVIGYTIWEMFSSTLQKCMKATEANKSLLTFPQVTPIDVMIARCLVIIATQIVCGSIFLFAGFCFGIDFEIRNILGLIFAIFFIFTSGLGIGMILSALDSYFSTIGRIVSIILGFGMFASGVMFPVTRFVGIIGDWILLNPVLQIIEYSRTCLSYTYTADFVSIPYLCSISFFSLTVGLLLEKFTRKRLLL